MKRILFCDDFHDAGLTDGHCDHATTMWGRATTIRLRLNRRPGQIGRKLDPRDARCSVSSQVKETRDNFAKALRAHRKRP